MKKLLAALCLLLICADACAAVSVRMDEGALLLEESGSVIVPLNQYRDIVPLGEGLFIACSEEGYALMNAEGTLLTPPLYSDFRLTDGMLMARRDGLWGLMGFDGHETGAFVYTQLVPNGSGGCWALKGNINDPESDELFLLDAAGRESTAEITVRRMAPLGGDGLIAVQMPDEGIWGYCNSLGEMVIPAAFSYAGTFSNGCAVVVSGGAYGLINSSGEMLIAPEYDSMEISGAGFVLATAVQQGARVFDLQGREIARYEGEDIFAAIAGQHYAVVDSESMRVYSARGELMGESSPDTVIMEGVGSQMIISDGAWGENCVRLSGTQALWQNLYPLGTAGDEALYACMQGYAARFMSDRLGEIQYAMDMESARYGVVNGTGELVIPCEYETIEYLGDDRLLLHVDSLWQMCDSSGRVYWQHGFRETEEASD